MRNGKQYEWNGKQYDPSKLDSQAYRIRKGLCLTCPGGQAPVQLYEINKRLGGLKRERMPVNRPGVSHDGICFVCQPERDPARQQHQLRGSVDYAEMVEEVMRRRMQAQQGGHLGLTNQMSGTYNNSNMASVSQMNGTSNNHGASGVDLGQLDLGGWTSFQTPVQQQHQQQSLTYQQAETMTIRLPAGCLGIDDIALKSNKCVVVSDNPNSPLRVDDEIISINKIKYSSMTSWNDWVSLLQLTSNGERTALVSRPVQGVLGSSDVGSLPAQYGNHHGGYGSSGVGSVPAQYGNQAHAHMRPPQEGMAGQSQWDRSAYSHGVGGGGNSNNGDVRLRPSLGDEDVSHSLCSTCSSTSSPMYQSAQHLQSAAGNDGETMHQQQRSAHCQIDGSNNISPQRYSAIREEDAGQESTLRANEAYLDNLYISEPPPASRARPDDDEGTVVDVLARLIAQHVKAETGEDLGPNPAEALLVNDTLNVGMSDDISVLTPVTFLMREDLTVNMRDGATVNTASSNVSWRSAFRERNTERCRLEGPPASLTAKPRRIREEAIEVDQLRDEVDKFIHNGQDREMIEYVCNVLSDNNLGEQSEEVALFCFTKLRIHARMSSKFKKKIAKVDGAIGTIIETLTLFSEASADVTLDGCGLVWLLCMSDSDRRAVVESGGAESVLNCCLAQMENGEVSTLAMGALKALSFDDDAKAIIRGKDGMSIAFEVMNENVTLDKIQTEGCAVLELLAVDASNEVVHTVPSLVVDAVLDSMMIHSSSVDVGEAVINCLTTFACNAENLPLIEGNGKARVALESAFKNHPRELGLPLLSLLAQLTQVSKDLAKSRAEERRTV